jgi:hypothetical protein
MRYTAITAAIAACFLVAPAPAVGAKPRSPTEAGPMQTEARAEAKANVVVLYAYNGKKGIDKKLPDEVKKKLKEPPFSAYDSYELVEKVDLPLTKMKESAHPLPNKDTLKLELRRVNENKKYEVRVSITRKKDNETKELVGIDAKMKRDELFFVAGPKYKEGILVLGLRVGPT